MSVEDVIRLTGLAVAVIGILGGLAHWWDRFTSRRKILVRNVSDSNGFLAFEAENVGLRPTSLSPLVKVTGLSPKLEKQLCLYDVIEDDRSLPPLRPKQFTAKQRESVLGWDHSWFRKYIFRPTRGLTTRLRVRNAYLEPIGFWRFRYERFVMVRFQRVPSPKGKGRMTVDEYEKWWRTEGKKEAK